MRDVTIIIVILSIIFIGEICAKQYLNKTADGLLEDLEHLKENTIQAKETENREEIKKEIIELEEKWDKISSIWSVIILHQELDNVEQYLVRAKSNIEAGELEDALQEIETAIFFAEHVKLREKLSWKNIL